MFAWLYLKDRQMDRETGGAAELFEPLNIKQTFSFFCFRSVIIMQMQEYFDIAENISIEYRKCFRKQWRKGPFSPTCHLAMRD